MSTEESGLIESQVVAVGTIRGTLTSDGEPCRVGEHEAFDRQVFRMALALANEPSKLWQLRQMLGHLEEESEGATVFSSWAIGQVDQKVMSMALEYADDAEVLLQILSFIGDTLGDLMHCIEALYQQGQITQRVYARAKLLLRINEQA